MATRGSKIGKATRKEFFERPAIIGALCAAGQEVPREIARGLSKCEKQIAYLPFQVERRFLKNTIACMRLMDIAGLTIAPSHERHIARHIPRKDEIANISKTADTLVRHGKTFIGYNAKGMAVLRWLNECADRQRGRRTALIVGSDPYMPSIIGALLADGWKIRKRPSKEQPPALVVVGSAERRKLKDIEPLIKESSFAIDLRDTDPIRKAKGAKLSRKALMKLFCHISVDLLTAHI